MRSGGAPRTVSRRESLRVGGETIPPGESRRFELRVARLFSGDWLTLPLWVYHGSDEGPRLWLDAAIHGDELNGMEIIRQVTARLDPEALAGSVLAVPVVNVFGFVQGERYLPDRRDLNRSFPGSAHGSLAGRLAHLFLGEVVAHCHYGIDLHTGSNHRSNLPQLRAHLGDPESRRLAEAFGSPMMYEAPTIGGSLRAIAKKRGLPILVFEGGEPLRFDEEVIRIGVRGVLNVMAELGMGPTAEPREAPTFEAGSRKWMRASRSGIFYREIELGDWVEKGARLGRIADLQSGVRAVVRSPFDGMVIGHTRNPLTHQGDALVHLARRKGEGDGGD